MKQIPATVYSRCCGYFSAVAFGNKKGLWNAGKTEEYYDRVNMNYKKYLEQPNENISKIL